MKNIDAVDGAVENQPRPGVNLWKVTAAGLAGSALLGLLAAIGTRWAFPVATAITLAVYAAFARAVGVRVGVVLLLILTCALDAFEFSVGSVFVRSEQIAAALGLVVVLAVRDQGRRWWLPSSLELVLIAWFALNIVSTLISAPEVGRSIKVLALIVVSSGAMLIPRRLNLGPEGFRLAVQFQLLVFAGVAAYGLLALLLHPIFHSDFGLTFNSLTKQLVASGSLWESNAFGDYCAAGAIAWALLGHRWFGWRWAGGGLGLCACGALVSLTRAAWLALLIVAITIAVGRVRRDVDARSLGIAATIASSALVVFGLATGAGFFSASGGPHRPQQALTYTAMAIPQSRPFGATNGSPQASTPIPPGTPSPEQSSSSTAATMALDVRIVNSMADATLEPSTSRTKSLLRLSGRESGANQNFRRVLSRPETRLSQTGTASPGQSPSPSVGPSLGGFMADIRDILGRLDQVRVVWHDLRSHPLLGGGTASYGERYKYQGAELWIASLPLRVVNDTGLVGIAVFGLFLFFVAATTLSARRNVVGTTFGLILLLILLTNLSTETLELMFTWLFIGLAAAAAELSATAHKQASDDQSPHPSA